MNNLGDFSNEFVDNDFIDQFGGDDGMEEDGLGMELGGLEGLDGAEDFPQAHSRQKQMELSDAIRDANIETQPRSSQKL